MRIWSTPQRIFDKLNAEFGFTVDACADEENAKCLHFYSLQSGLQREWVGTCWLNPPYGKEIKEWMKKALNESLSGATVVALVPNRSNAPWWHEYVMKAHEIRFVKKKVQFVGGDGVPFWGVCVVVFRPRVNGSTPIVPVVSSWDQPSKPQIPRKRRR